MEQSASLVICPDGRSLGATHRAARDEVKEVADLGKRAVREQVKGSCRFEKTMHIQSAWFIGASAFAS